MKNPFSFLLPKKEKRSLTVDYVDSLGLPYNSVYSPVSITTALQLSAVYRCVDVISNDIASQPFDILQFSGSEGWSVNEFHKHNRLLNYEPNPSMSKFSLWKTCITKVLLEGNGLIEIIRDGIGEPTKLILLNENFKMYQRDDGSIYYIVGYPGLERKIEGEDIIHIINFSYNGMMGISTLSYAVNSLNLSGASEASAKGFFTSGANMSGILTTEGKLTKEKADSLKASWAAAFDVTDGTPGGIAVMESGLEFKPVTVNPKDAQMLETRKFNVIDICRFFGVSPSKAFDDNNLTYSNIESFQLGYLTDTISPFDSKIESEVNRKLFRPSQRSTTKVNLNINELLRANLDAKANYVSKMFQVGGYNVNEVRKECGNPKYNHANAEKPMVQINLVSVDKIGTKEKPVDKNTTINQSDNGKGSQDN